MITFIKKYSYPLLWLIVLLIGGYMIYNLNNSKSENSFPDMPLDTTYINTIRKYQAENILIEQQNDSLKSENSKLTQVINRVQNNLSKSHAKHIEAIKNVDFITDSVLHSSISELLNAYNTR